MNTIFTIMSFFIIWGTKMKKEVNHSL